jgi:hypothetical protein
MNDYLSFTVLAKHYLKGYSSPVTANSVTGCRNPSKQKAPSAQNSISGVFLCLKYRVMAAVCGRASALPGSFCPGIPTLHTAATQSRRKDRGSSSAEGAPPMQCPLNFSARSKTAHVKAWKARAFAALRADSSLSVRLTRYNAAMSRARALEAQGGAA